MRSKDPQLLADELAIGLRWLGIVGMAIYLGLQGGFAIGGLLVLMLIAGWNMGMLVLNLWGRRLPQHPYVMIAVDAVFGLLLILAITVGDLPFAWGGLLAVITAAMYFGTRGGLITASVMLVLLFGALLGLGTELLIVAQVLVLPVAAFFAIGAGGGSIARQLGQVVRQQDSASRSQRMRKEKLDRDRMQAIYNITATLTSTLDHKRVLDLALDVSAAALSEPEQTSAGLTSTFLVVDGDRLVVGSARGFTSADMKAVLPGFDGVVIRALETGAPQISENPIDDPELRRITAFHHCQQVYVYPLRTGREVFGALVYGHQLDGYFSDTRLEVLEIIGRQSLVALQNAALYSELVQEKERMVEVQEEAQRKLARDLHDGPTQSVAAIAMRVNFARRLIERDAKAAGEELFKIEDLARRTTRKKIRHMLFTLRPLVLESAGLVAALQSMAEKMAETYDQNVIVEAEQAIVEELELGKQGVIFYIAEEAVNNARKHAEAAHIWVRLKPTKEPDICLLEIQDDGVGFDVGAVDAGYESRGSLGMVNMRERTQMLNGLLRLQSAVGKGTRIRVWVPVSEDAAMKLRQGN